MERPTFQALEMPYKGSGVSMVVFLPKKVDGLKEFEQSLTPERLAACLDKLSEQRVGVLVTFPRFKLKSEMPLVTPLYAMGIKTAFNPRANPSDLFGRMLEKKSQDSPDLPLFVSDVLQKAWIEVNEKGTEAAAATRVIARVTGIPPPPKIFRADHPFMFMIIHKASNCILFMGRVTRPQQK